MKKVFCFTLVFMMLLGIFNVASANEEIQIFLNGEKIVTDVAPQLINDRTMVPVRFIFEALGAAVTWESETMTAKGYKTGIEIDMTVGENYFLRNGKEFMLDSPAVIVDGRTLVPVRAIAESFNCKVEWDEETSSVLITTDEIVFAVCPDFPPFSYKDTARKIVGRDIELAVEIADKLGKIPVFVEYNLNGTLEAVENGKADVALSGYPYVEEWCKNLTVSDVYYVSTQAIVTNKNSNTDKNNLEGKIIGVIENTVAETYIKEDFVEKRVRTYSDLDSAFNALSKVEIACIIADKNMLEGTYDDFRLCDEAYITEEYVMYLSKDNEELKKQINSVIAEK